MSYRKLSVSKDSILLSYRFTEKLRNINIKINFEYFSFVNYYYQLICLKMKDNLKRVIVDFKKLTPEILALLVERYPDGYDDVHIIKFKNAKNELIEAVEVTTEDTKYLVKVSTKLAVTMENYDEDDYEDYDDDDPEAVKAPEDINDDIDLGD